MRICDILRLGAAELRRHPARFFLLSFACSLLLGVFYAVVLILAEFGGVTELDFSEIFEVMEVVFWIIVAVTIFIAALIIGRSLSANEKVWRLYRFLGASRIVILKIMLVYVAIYILGILLFAWVISAGGLAAMRIAEFRPLMEMFGV